MPDPCDCPSYESDLDSRLCLGLGSQGLEYIVWVYVAEDGGLWGEVEDLPGCVAQGETLADLKVNLKDAIEAFEDVFYV